MSHLSRRQLLSAALALGITPVPALASAPMARKLVVVLADGGWDSSFVLDPKFHSDLVDGPQVDENPDDPDDREALSTFGNLPIATNEVKRPAVTRFFERYAPHCALVHGIWMGAIAHKTARVRILTGTHTQAKPAWAAIAGHALGTDTPIGSFVLSAPAFAGELAASIGQLGRRGQLRAILSPEDTFPAPDDADWTLPLFRPDPTDQERIASHLQARNRAFLDRVAKGSRNERLLHAREEAMDRGRRVRVEGADAIGSLVMGPQPTLGRQVELAA
ncbi:MAG: hypothetical protein AAF211_33630, partial [Myxococcota bacterium]